MKNKKTCLLILPRPIFPNVGGYFCNRSEAVKMLSKEYNLFVIVLSNKGLTAEDHNFFTNLNVEYKAFVFPQWRFYLNAFMALFSKKPIQVGYYRFCSVTRFVRENFSTVDIAVASLIRTVDYLNVLPKKTIKVFDMVDSIGLNYQRSQNHVKSLFWKWIYKVEYSRLLRYEEKWVKKANVSFLFNRDETNYWSKYGHVVCVPHGVKDILFSYDKRSDKYENSVAFLGRMDYQPNVDAVKWYIENVHPLTGKEFPFVIVGGFPTKEIIDLSKKHPNITVTGFVDDPYEILNSSLCCIAPMQTGGGIQNKLLETMALGQINVVSSLAANPIVGTQHNKHLWVADSGEEMADIIKKIGQNREDYTHLGTTAKELIKASYSWGAFSQVYLLEINKLIRQ